LFFDYIIPTGENCVFLLKKEAQFSPTLGIVPEPPDVNSLNRWGGIPKRLIVHPLVFLCIKQERLMLTSLHGVYRKGKIEIEQPPKNIQDETR